MSGAASSSERCVRRRLGRQRPCVEGAWALLLPLPLASHARAPLPPPVCCSDRWENVGYLAIFIAVFQVLAVVAIRFIRHIRR